MTPESKTTSKTEIKDIYYLEDIEQLEAIADGLRYQMCLLMNEPKTGAQLARALGISRARAHYHLNVLEKVGLVRFHHEGMSHGIVEKYYQAVAEYFDFSNLIPKDQQTLVPNEITLRSFKAAVSFISNLLDMSREGISRLKVHEGLGIGFHYILNTKLRPEQFRLLREDFAALKDRIIELEQENEQVDDDDDGLVSCRITLFLTPVSDELLEAELSNEENGGKVET